MELAVDLNRSDLGTAVADLAALGSRVAPVGLARERTLPVPDTLTDLFAEGGLVRGRTIACAGPGATSMALALIAPAIAAGSWLAMIDVPTVGLDAASELGIPLERIVAIASGDDHDRSARWPDVVAAAADGFDVLLARVPADVPPAVMRKVVTRLRQREVVMVVVGDPGSLSCDGTLRTGSPEWSGLGDGHGYLRRRQMTVHADGRRVPGARRRHLAIPA